MVQENEKKLPNLTVLPGSKDEPFLHLFLQVPKGFLWVQLAIKVETQFNGFLFHISCKIILLLLLFFNYTIVDCLYICSILAISIIV